jgi:predicted kinase
MSVIINPRGASGSGKTELARRILAGYGWGREGRPEPIHRRGRDRPIAYRLAHPLGGRPLAVLGHYETTSGGCDTIRLVDGGMAEIFRLADAYACSGHDVLLEGLLLSNEERESAALAEKHELHVLCLDTPLDRRVQNLIARRRTGWQHGATIARTTGMQQQEIEQAYRRLRACARVEVLDFDTAFRRARQLLGLARIELAA